MTVQLIPLARWSDGAWVDLAGNPYIAPDLPAGASFVCSSQNGTPVIEMLTPGTYSELSESVYETRCQECGQYMQVRPPQSWKPKPVFVRCDECIAKDAMPVNKEQELIKEFPKLMRRR